MAVIGFLTYQDFVAELDRALALGKGPLVVRVQDHYVPIGGGQARFLDFRVQVALEVGADVLVCNLRIGTDLEVNRPRRQELTEDAARAADLVRQDLQRRAVRTAPGLIAAADASRTAATAPELFHFRERRLQAGPAPAAEVAAAAEEGSNAHDG